MLVGIFVISETKLDENFLSPQFEKPNYKMFRRDRLLEEAMVEVSFYI